MSGNPPPRSQPPAAHAVCSPVSARSTALDLLLIAERDKQLTDEQRDLTLKRAALPVRDRALVTELTYGVLRHRETIDWRLAHVSDRRIDRLPMVVLMALRLGAYQILYLQRIPHSAAVNESVLLVRSRAAKSRRDWSGFVNAVLRALLREPVPSWPDPTKEPVRALSVRYSCPTWLAQRWVDRFGEDAEHLCRSTSDVPPLTLRTNTLSLTRAILLERLCDARCTARETMVSPVGVRLDKGLSVTETPGFHEGWFYIEDEAAQLIPGLLDPQPGERVLDACAAPGGKTTHLAALMENHGVIVAVDQNPRRIQMMNENCRRLGISIVTPLMADIRQLSPSTQPRFDRILVDSPCSGLGVLRRHPEGKWQKESASLIRHHQLQCAILEGASRLLRPGGVLVYSTCSTEPEENEQVVEQFCRTHAEFQREGVGPWLSPAVLAYVTGQGDLSTALNAHSMDAFFAARLRRIS
ncbi:MAG: 16S rRNA (cytosine(967)-C(5))-methyltransferase RsmB [Nitrospiraceae bacterium]